MITYLYKSVAQVLKTLVLHLDPDRSSTFMRVRLVTGRLSAADYAPGLDSPRLLAEVESRTQGSRPRPRTQKKSEAKAKDSLSEDRHSRGQGQECSRPRTKDTKRKCSPKKKKKKRSSQKFFRRSPKKKKKKKVFTKIFQAISTKKRFPQNISTAPQNFNFPKNSAVLEPRTSQFSRT